MGGSFSLNKGKRGEREVMVAIQGVVNSTYRETHLGRQLPTVVRNTLQSRLGGCDLSGIDWLAVEVKFHDSEFSPAWWEQCKRQAGPGQEPVLVWRRNRSPWKVMMYGRLPALERAVKAPVVIPFDTFLVWLRVRLIEEDRKNGLPLDSRPDPDNP